MTTIKEEQLSNGLQITFTDKSNRYFGDYHRICVVATIVCQTQDLPAESLDDETFKSRAIESFGNQISVVKSFERMGVPTAYVEDVRAALVDDFLKHAKVYLSRPEYPRSLFNAELKKKATHRFYG